MAKVRVHELAKELGITSKDAVSKLQELGEFVRSASSTIEAPVVKKLRDAFPAAAPKQRPAAAPKAAPKPWREARREGSTEAPAAAPAPAPAAAAPSGSQAPARQPKQPRRHRSLKRRSG